MKLLSLEKILTVAAVTLLFLVVGSITYDQFGKSDVTVTVNLDDSQDPFSIIPRLNAPGEIKSVKEIDRAKNEFEIVYRTSKTKPNILRLLLGYRDVEDAKVH